MEKYKLHIPRVDFYCVVEINKTRLTDTGVTILDGACPVLKGKDFYWDSKENKIRYKDRDYLYTLYREVVYPLCGAAHIDKLKETDNQQIIDFLEGFSESAWKENKKKRDEQKAQTAKEMAEKEAYAENRHRDRQEKAKTLLADLRDNCIEENENEIKIYAEDIESFLEFELITIPLQLRRALNNLSYMVIKKGKVQSVVRYGKPSFDSYRKIFYCVMG